MLHDFDKKAERSAKEPYRSGGHVRNYNDPFKTHKVRRIEV